ncbi:MAG: hypothetical protein IPK26_31090 [Planctomycetes bacterium]|nr:hypothetical protein [Planctomycetota bacterium]
MLRTSALLPFLLFPVLAQQTKDDPVQRAVAAMTASRRPGLCIVPPVNPTLEAQPMPVADREALRTRFHERLAALGLALPAMTDDSLAEITPLNTIGNRFLTRLNLLLLTDDAQTQLLLDEAVLLVASPERVGGKPDETLVLFDAQGKRIAGARASLTDEAAFVAAMDGLLQVVRKPKPSDMTRRVLTLASADQTGPRQEAIPLAIRHWREVAPLLQQELATATAERRNDLAALARDAMRSVVGLDRAGLLPFGCEWQDEQRFDPCPGCGMAMVGAPAKRMLRLSAR